jgi:hypothetical protein
MVITVKQLMDVQENVGPDVVVSVGCAGDSALGISFEWKGPDGKPYGLVQEITRAAFRDGALDMMIALAVKKVKSKTAPLPK